MKLSDLATAERISVREFQAGHRVILRKRSLTVITRFGTPVAVLVPWKMMVNLLLEIETKG